MENPEIDKAISVFNAGGIVIFPTDTAFGIGCRIDKESSVERLFRIRNRPKYQPTPVLVSSEDMASEYFDKITPRMQKLMHTYWPGALTIVSTCRKDLVYTLVRGGGDTIGLRMPNNLSMLHIISSVGVPILAPSANLHGNATPYTLSDLDPNLIKSVDYVLPGTCLLKNVSTVVLCMENEIRILRQGAIQLE